MTSMTAEIGRSVRKVMMLALTRKPLEAGTRRGEIPTSWLSTNGKWGTTFHPTLSDRRTHAR